MFFKNSVLQLFIVSLVILFLFGCSKENPSFSLLPESNVFNQSVNVDTKVDVLFVVDNSNSMAPAQANLTTNFSAFISSFVDKNFDFHIGVITTDVWKANFNWGPSYARLVDGKGSNHSGVFVITPQSENIEGTFLINATVGIGGLGDERAFQSFKTSLESPLNADFRRDEAFLAIIIVSDEDDFSNDNNLDVNENYESPDLHTIEYYNDFLQSLTGSTDTLKRYSVNSIQVLDSTCLAQSHFAANIGNRYAALVDATGGIKGSICAPDFSTELDKIQQGILVLASQFHLPRIPVVNTIRVIVNGQVIPNDAVSGWVYDSQANSIVFSYSAIPPQGATIVVNYEPTTILN